MTEEDLSMIIEIERASYPFPWSMENFLDCLRAGYCCRVLDEGKSSAARDRLPLPRGAKAASGLDRSRPGGSISGYGIISVGGGESDLLNLCIPKEKRHRGFARRLLAHLVNTARERNAETMFLEVRPSNLAACRLYQHVGFNEVGTRPAYYPGSKGPEDALIMALTL